VQRIAIRLRVHRYGADAKVATGPDHAQRDLTTVCYQNGLDHGQAAWKS